MRKECLQPYDIVTETYTTNTNIAGGFIDILIVNRGTVTASINGVFDIQPGETLPISGNVNEIMLNQVQISFANVAGTKLLKVLKRVYV